jgi:tRNA(Ile)-lysidine synthetase-like protein
MPSPLTNAIERFLARHHVSGRVLLAVSGGPDSMVLLHAMTQCYPREQLLVGHFNHRLRGEASEADAQLVASVSQQLNIPCEQGTTDCLNPDQTSLEAQARRLRYTWLEQVAERKGCHWLLTGHTQNDQAETVLHHLIRGTGWRGLRGIAPVRALSQSLLLGRPLITSTKAAVMHYLQSNNIQFAVDATNDDLHFTRNRLRHRVLPELLKINPHAIQHLAQWAEVARQQYRLIRGAARVSLKLALVHQDENAVSLKVAMLCSTDEAILQEALRQLWRMQSWPTDEMTRKHWHELMEVCQGKRQSLELPGKLLARCRLDDIVQLQRITS